MSVQTQFILSSPLVILSSPEDKHSCTVYDTGYTAIAVN